MSTPTEILWREMPFFPHSKWKCFLIQPQYISSFLTLRIISRREKKKKKIWHRHQKTPALAINYKFKSYSYFSWVKMVLPAQFASLSVSIVYIYVRWWTPPKPSQMRRLRQAGAKCCGWEDGRRNSFPGSTEGIWAFCKTAAQRKGELFFFFFLRPYAPVPHRSSSEWDMRSRDTAGPSRAGVPPRLSITHTNTHAHAHLYTAVYTL